MINSQDLQFFAVVAASPSLAAAARSLNVTPPAVSQRLRQLELRLGLHLIDRGSNRLNLTAEGETLAARGTAVLDELEGIAAELVERREIVSGALQIAAPFGFGRAYVAGALAGMRLRFPAVEPSLTLCDDPAGRARTGSWDVLIHVGSLADSGLKMQRLAPNARILCAAPDYLNQAGTPVCPDDLRRHHCGVIREDQADVSLWRFRNDKGNNAAVRIVPAFASNDGDVIRSWAVAGLGIVQRSEWAVADDLRAGRLVRLLPGWHLPDADVVALRGPRTGRALRADRFVEILRGLLTPAPWRSNPSRA